MGPYVTQMLGDFGAEVIKVEAPEGDILRGIGPHGQQRMGPLFLNLNRNKRSIVLDLKSAGGKTAFLKLAETADVLVYNVRPAAMQRLGLGYEALRAVNPRLIYVGTFGFSQRGRYAAEAAFDDLIQAAVAIPAAMAENSGDIPRYVPTAIADRSVGLYALGVICAALVARARSGIGQAIDVPMFETMTNFVLGDHLYGETFVPAEGGMGYPRMMTPERRPYKTRDGYVCCVVYTDGQWRGFLDLIGEGDLFDSDPRFVDIGARTRHIADLYQLLGKALEARTTAEWRRDLGAIGITVFPMNTFETLLEDPHLADIGFFTEVEHPSEGTLRSMACPSEWSGTPPGVPRPAPRIGEHSREILAEIGYDAAAIAALEQAGVTRGTEWLP